MPTPAPRAPRPMPSASAMALPASATSPVVAANRLTMQLLLVFGLDGRADVDAGHGGEDIRLDRDDDNHLEAVKEKCQDYRRGEHVPIDQEDEADRDEDQHVAREHVRVEPDAQR